MLADTKYDVRSLANFVLDYAESLQIRLTNMAVNKLVYFMVEHSIVDRNVLITEAKIEAWEHGPVFREIYSSFKPFGDRPICSRATRFDSLTRSMMIADEKPGDKDREYFLSVLSRYITMSAAQLRAISHAPDGPWHRVWDYEGTSNPGMQITADIIRDAMKRTMH